jgi:hypothetical protein
MIKLLIRIALAIRSNKLGALNHPAPFNFLKRFYTNRELVAAYAQVCLGKDMAPTQDELGCAEAVNTIVSRVLGRPVGGDVSTYRMYNSMLSDRLFYQISAKDALPGDIWISTTGYGDRRKVSNGHVAIVGRNKRLLSNNSITGLFDAHWSIAKWYAHYQTLGSYPVCVFRIRE